MGTLAQNQKTCMRCAFAGWRRQTCNGSCPCTLDGRDIQEHVVANDCPKGFYASGEPERPLTYRETEGPKRWAELHRRAGSGVIANDEATFIAKLADGLGLCSCRHEWAKLLEEMPPDLSSPSGYEAWAIAAHNAVNLRLGKPLVEKLPVRDDHATFKLGE